MRCRTIIKFRNSDDPNDLGFGRGIVQLLEGVEELGSINRATASMGMAYSKAWKIINAIEKEFDVRLIDREGAHGSHLTEEARTLIQRYHEALDAADANVLVLVVGLDLDLCLLLEIWSLHVVVLSARELAFLGAFLDAVGVGQK